MGGRSAQHSPLHGRDARGATWTRGLRECALSRDLLWPGACKQHDICYLIKGYSDHGCDQDLVTAVGSMTFAKDIATCYSVTIDIGTWFEWLHPSINRTTLFDKWWTPIRWLGRSTSEVPLYVVGFVILQVGNAIKGRPGSDVRCWNSTPGYL